MTTATQTKIATSTAIASIFGADVVKLPKAQERKSASAIKAFAASVKSTHDEMEKSVTEALDYLNRKASSACQMALGIVIDKARTPVFARLSEADYAEFIAPWVNPQIDRLPLGAASKPIYKVNAKSQFLAASWGIASEINNFSEAAVDMKRKLVAVGICAESKAGAKKGPKTPTGGTTTTTPAATTTTPAATTTTPAATTPAQGAVSGNKLSDKAYDAAVFAFITALGIKGKDAENVRTAFGPTSLETTLRLLASSVG